MKKYIKKVHTGIKGFTEKAEDFIDKSVEEAGKSIDTISDNTGKIVDQGIKKADSLTKKIKGTKKSPKTPIPEYDFGVQVSDELHAIIEARKKSSSFIRTTGLDYSERLSEIYKADIYLKREDRTKVRSYKIRGAFNLISGLSLSEKKAGVVCASAGNHAQGFAITCAHLEIQGTVFMPVTTPEQKVHKTKKFGGDFVEVKLVGDTFDEAFAESKKFEEEFGATFVHPFDDPRIIEGQATVGIEILKQLGENPDYLICPIGGGGLSAGLVKVFSELSPETKIIGVEPEGAPAMQRSLKNKKLTALKNIDIFVDGAAVKNVGKHNFSVLKKSNIEVHTVPENRICTTILEYLREDGIIVEPAGALSTDYLKDMNKEDLEGKKIVLVLSGGNLDFERLPSIKERSRKFEGVKRYFLVSFPQRPGALRDFLQCLGPNDDIARFEYLKKSNKDTAPVFIGIETDNKKNFERITKKMLSCGFKHKDLTDDDLIFDLLV